MSKYNAYQSDFPTISEIDYNFYIQRGKVEQARAAKQVFSGLSQWFKSLAANINHYGHRLSAASEKRVDSWKYANTCKQTSPCA